METRTTLQLLEEQTELLREIADMLEECEVRITGVDIHSRELFELMFKIAILSMPVTFMVGLVYGFLAFVVLAILRTGGFLTFPHV